MERRCDACGHAVWPDVTGSICRPCDVALCGACLAGTERCPSCQRRFAETRALAPVVRRAPARPHTPAPPRNPLVMPVVIAIAVAGVYAAISISRELDRREVESLASLPTMTAADQARLDAYRAAEARRRERFDARDVRAIRATIDTEACPIDVTPPRELPEGVAVTGSWGALERDFMSSLRTYLVAFADGMEVMPLAREGVGPITRSTGDSYAFAARDHELVLVVESWVDPILPEHIPPEGTTFTVGRLTGRLLLWSYQEDRVVCAAEVDATNAAVTVVRSNLDGRNDDPLDRARIDLVVQAVRSGASALRTATDSVR